MQNSKRQGETSKHTRSNLITLTQILSYALRNMNWKYENYSNSNLKTHFEKQ